MLVTWFFVENCIEKSWGSRTCKGKRVLPRNKLVSYYSESPDINRERYKWNFGNIFSVIKNSIAVLLNYFWREIKVSANEVSGTPND
jgi:hypothetical protein